MLRRILHLLPDLRRGGGQGVALQLVTYADRDRFEMHVARLHPPDDLAEAFAALGAEPIRLRHTDHGAAVAAIELAQHLRRLRIDLLHVHSDEDRKVGQLAALMCGVAVVGHLHSPWAHLEPMHAEDAGALARGWSKAKASERRGVERRTVRHYLAAGEEVAAFHEGRVPAPITVVNNGIDVQHFVPASDDVRREARVRLGIDRDAIVLISVGRLAAGKGQDELIRVLAHVPEAVLVLVGDGEQREELEGLATEQDVSDRVRFLGDRNDVAEVLCAGDLFVMASVSEGLPLSVLEAMATGLPVLSYDLPGLHSVIVDGVDGRLVPLGDRESLAGAVNELIADQRARSSMGAASRETVTADFDARQMTLRAENVYDGILGNGLEGRTERVDDLIG